MNWDALGAIGELIGAGVTVVTLLYLALQIRHNKEAMQASTELEASIQLSAVSARTADNPDLRRIWDLVATNDPELTLAEAIHFTWHMAVIMHMYEGVWEQFQKGLVSDRIWKEYERSGSAVLRTPLMKTWWKKRIAAYSPEFYDYFDEVLEKVGDWKMPDGQGWVQEFLNERSGVGTNDHLEREGET